MKSWIAILSACLAMVSAAADEPAADAGEAKPLDAKITEVTVYADRARVVRTAVADLATGVGKFSFRKLPGWIDEGSVRLAVSPAAAGELVDVEVTKTFLARPEDDDIRLAEAAMQEVSDQLAALDDERGVLEAQARQLEAIRAFSLEKLPKDAVVREIKVDEYASLVTFIGNSLSGIAKARRELDKRQREKRPELLARQRTLNELMKRSQLEQRTVIVTIKSAGAALPAELRLTYMLPGATWEPVHELRTGGATDRVALASFGVVTQTTGEDWDGVMLSLSTQRSTDTIQIPELEKLLVGPRMPAGAADTFRVATGKFSGQIKTWNTYLNPPARQQEFESNLDVQQAQQRINLSRFARLQERRGTTAHFTAAGIQSVRTDGRPVRVLIGAEHMAAQHKIVAAPAVSLNAARTAELLNSGKQPLLPGQVLLYVDGAFLGATETDFVAPGESFPVFVGVADSVKLTRMLDRKRSSITWSGKRTRMQVSFFVSAENLGDTPVALQLADRIPITETDEVRVTDVAIKPDAKPDAKGVVRWDVALAAKEKKDFRLEYTLEYPKDLAQRIAVPNQNPVDAAAADEGIHAKMIGDLEMQLK
ncbi:MAG: mucoidy inhibitor MuiA family protein [Lentisphaerae bacterium]|nr:mucoidy inhibitor MuiA family protein [Lentisphaerota bacterium]